MKLLDKKKPKELDWRDKYKEKFGFMRYNKEDVDAISEIGMWDIIYENLKYFISETLTQQRTELLEEIKFKIEDRIKHVNIFSSETGTKFKDDVIEIINLLNKKDD